MSSSRVHTSLTGLPICLATKIAWRISSLLPRRPKPPPRKQLWMAICSGLRPEVMPRRGAARPSGICVPTQMSSLSPAKCAVALSGSMVACASMRRLVERLDDLAAQICRLGECGIDIAVVARVHHRPVERVAIELGELRAVGLAGGARVPFRLEQRQRFLGAPEAVGDHRHRVVELDHLLACRAGP